MNVVLTRVNHLQTFSGADADLRFARDDGGDEDEALYEEQRNILPLKLDDDADESATPDQDDDQEE